MVVNLSFLWSHFKIPPFSSSVSMFLLLRAVQAIRTWCKTFLSLLTGYFYLPVVWLSPFHPCYSYFFLLLSQLLFRCLVCLPGSRSALSLPRYGGCTQDLIFIWSGLQFLLYCFLWKYQFTVRIILSMIWTPVSLS